MGILKYIIFCLFINITIIVLISISLLYNENYITIGIGLLIFINLFLYNIYRKTKNTKPEDISNDIAISYYNIKSFNKDNSSIFVIGTSESKDGTKFHIYRYTNKDNLKLFHCGADTKIIETNKGEPRYINTILGKYLIVPKGSIRKKI